MLKLRHSWIPAIFATFILTVNNGITVNSGAGAVTINSPVTVGAAQSWTNNSTNTLTVGGAVAIDNLLTLDGSGKTLLSVANTGSGGVTISNGTVQIGNNTVFGTGTLTLSGGTLSNPINGQSYTVSNDLVINGNVTFSQLNTGNTNTLTFTGANQGISGSPTINFTSTGSGAYVYFQTGAMVLNSDAVLTGGMTNGVFFNGGFNIPGSVVGTSRTLTFNAGASGYTVAGPLAGTASDQSLTLSGSGTGVTVGAITAGSNNPWPVLLPVDRSAPAAWSSREAPSRPTPRSARSATAPPSATRSLSGP